MDKKYIESDLCDRCSDVLDVCSDKQYQQMFLLGVSTLLHIHLSPDEINWDLMVEREKFEPADTN